MKLPKLSIDVKQLAETYGIIIGVFVVGIAILVLVALFTRNKMKLKQKNNTSMESSLESVPVKLSSFNVNDGKYHHNLRDYYIMSSHNSCCGGDYNDNYVDYSPLKMVIRRGARVLDFEIYSVDNKTVVAASPSDNYYLKGTYNSLPFDEVMNKVNTYAFSHGTCPNADDPLFLHFRIKSKQPHVYEDMTKSLLKHFKHRKLGNEYSYESRGENFGRVPIRELRGKVVFMCSRSNVMFEKTPLSEYINISSGGQFLRNLRNYDIQYTHNFNDMIDSNKKNMAITMPDLGETSKNMPVLIHFKYGCQMPCMNFQNVDSNLRYYLDYFNKANSAFVLKPEELRYKVLEIKKPTPADPKLSYARREIKKPFFKHQI